MAINRQPRHRRERSHGQYLGPHGHPGPCKTDGRRHRRGADFEWLCPDFAVTLAEEAPDPRTLNLEH